MLDMASGEKGVFAAILTHRPTCANWYKNIPAGYKIQYANVDCVCAQMSVKQSKTPLQRLCPPNNYFCFFLCV